MEHLALVSVNNVAFHDRSFVENDEFYPFFLMIRGRVRYGRSVRWSGRNCVLSQATSTSEHKVQVEKLPTGQSFL